MKARRVASLALALGVLLASTAPAQSYYDNVVIVLDSSGSMDETMGNPPVRKMDAAKAALKEVLKQVPTSTHVGLLVFSAANIEPGQEWVYPLGPRDDQKLIQAIDRPEPGDGTPLAAAIKAGADRLLQERVKQLGYGTCRLLVVTDGEETADPRAIELYPLEVMARGVTLDVIGVNMAAESSLARKSTSYRRADDPESLRRAVADVFAEVGGKQNDAADAEAFDLLKPIPSEMASSMTKALSALDNRPIGESSEARPRRNYRGFPPVPIARPAPGHQRAPGAPPFTSQGAPPGPSSAARRNVPLGPVVVFLLIFAVLAIKRMITRGPR